MKLNHGAMKEKRQRQNRQPAFFERKRRRRRDPQPEKQRRDDDQKVADKEDGLGGSQCEHEANEQRDDQEQMPIAVRRQERPRLPSTNPSNDQDEAKKAQRPVHICGIVEEQRWQDLR